jgi:hypothetical protein
MSDSDKAVPLPNYSAEQIAAITAAANPLDIDKAKALELVIGKTYRSIISKCKSLGLPYATKPAPLKRVAKITKSELVAEIESQTGITSLDGLEKATMAALVSVVDFVHSVTLAVDSELDSELESAPEPTG